MKLEVFDSSREALRAVSDHLAKAIEDSHLKPFHLALSGGDTAQLLFKVWTEEYREKIDWDAIRFYWVDERCVSPEDDRVIISNAEELLFQPTGYFTGACFPYLRGGRSGAGGRALCRDFKMGVAGIFNYAPFRLYYFRYR